MFFSNFASPPPPLPKAQRSLPLYLTRFLRFDLSPYSFSLSLSLFLSPFLFSSLIFRSNPFPSFRNASLPKREKTSRAFRHGSRSVRAEENVSTILPLLLPLPPSGLPVSYRFRWRRRAGTWMGTHNPDICRFSGNKTRVV